MKFWLLEESFKNRDLPIAFLFKTTKPDTWIMDMLHDPDVRPFGDSLGLVQTTDPLLGTSVKSRSVSSKAACQPILQSDAIFGEPVGQIDLYRFLAFWTLEFDYPRRRRDLVQHTPATVRAFLRNPHVFPLFSQYHHLP